MNISLDMKNRTIRFNKNGKKEAVAYKIAKDEYKLAIGMQNKDGSVTIIDFKQRSHQ